VFKEPDWDASIDFESRLSAVPESALVRGMFLQFLIEAIGADPAPYFGNRRRYVAFKTYPMREYVELLKWGSQQIFPRVPAAEAVRRFGRKVYPNYAATVTGTAIFAVAGRSFARVVELTPAAYKVSVPSAHINVRELQAGHAVVELRELWNLPDFHQVGIWEGAMRVCNAVGQIRVHVRDLDAVDFDIHWRDATVSARP
jgi:uncharacterized protein (TIGR02265 family)